MSGWAEVTFRCMGSDVRLVAGPGLEPAAAALGRERAWLEDAAFRLSRFEPDSELSRLNADPHDCVSCSPLLRAAVAAGVWAAEATGGLVDPTLLGELEAAGYRDSRDAAQPASLREALAAAPPRRPARPRADARWRTIEVLENAVRRPPGIRFDTGGIGKGLLADALAHRLGSHRWAMIDCGGDIRVTGEPFPVEVSHPLTGEHVHRLVLADGGIATSGLDVNCWRRADGTYAHHLLDPSTGDPAWTGLVGATALAPTALEAETVAKAALFGGPAAARALLVERGGVAFHDDGDVELIGPLARLTHPVAA